MGDLTAVDKALLDLFEECTDLVSQVLVGSMATEEWYLGCKVCLAAGCMVDVAVPP